MRFVVVRIFPTGKCLCMLTVFNKQGCVDLLLRGGADPSLKDCEGWTPAEVLLQMQCDKVHIGICRRFC